MSKQKRRSKKAAKRRAAAYSALELLDAAPQPVPEPTGRTPGQRLYDLPYSAPAPRMTNVDLDLHNLVARAGHNAAYSIDVTLLDAPDHRLIRSGVLLAHRVLDGRGEWFLTAPDWQPLLPKDRIELMGHADLPEQLADLIRPLRRRATLGPVAALTCDRREFALRNGAGATVALLRDDKVTVRRGGLTTARYREVMITPVGPGLTDDQSAWVDRALIQAGATAVPRFPRLVTRLGAPATGPTDIPEPTAFDPAAPFKRFVSQLLALRLRRIVEADLAVRGGDLAAGARLVDQAERVRIELKGLSSLLDPDWVEDLYDELGWLSLESPTGDLDGAERLAARLRGERYLTVLERLVSAVRAPKLAESRIEPAGDALAGLQSMAVARFRHSADALAPGSSADAWDEAVQELHRLEWVCEVSGQVLPEAAAQLSRRLTPIGDLLRQIQQDHQHEQEVQASVAELDPAAAFAAGRHFEHEAERAQRTRRQFVRQWAASRKKLAG